MDGFVAIMGDRRRAYRGLVWKPERKNHWEELRWGDNFRIDL